MLRRRSFISRSFQFPKRLAWCAAALLIASPSSAQYENDIGRWVEQDQIAAPEDGSILFVGSSSIRRWERLTHDFADYRVTQRGFGGAHFDDVNRFADQIVLPYNPSAIVVWAGTNDIGSGGQGQEVFEDYQEFIAQVHAAQPGVDIFYLGIMPTPGRFANGPEETVANSSIAALASGNPKLHYVDLPAAFNALNPPSDQGFLDKFVDSIHLNRAGYDLWTSIIRPQLEAVVAPNKTFVANPNTLKSGERLLFDFGPSNTEDGDPTASPDANGNHWNNWRPAEGGVAVNAGERVVDLVNTSGDATGINLTITGGFQTNGKQNGGLFSPDEALLGDLAVESATQDYFFTTANNLNDNTSDDQPGGFMLDGLNPAQVYDLKFFGSRQTTALRETEYLAIGANTRVATLQTSGFRLGENIPYDGNNSSTVVLEGVRPDAFGQVFIDVTLSRGAFAYLNAMEVSVAVPEPTSGSVAACATGLCALSASRAARSR